MINLDLTRLEHNDIIEYLKYAQDQKRKQKLENENKVKSNFDKFDTTIYDINRISQLIEILNYKGSRTSIYKRSDSTYMSQREIYKTNYEKRKQEKNKTEGLIKIL